MAVAVTVIVTSTATVTGAVTGAVTVDYWYTAEEKLFLDFDYLSQHTKPSAATLQQEQQLQFCLKTSGSQELLPVNHLGPSSG